METNNRTCIWSFVSSLLHKHSLRGLNIYRCMLPCLTLYIIKYYTPTERVHNLQMFNKGWKRDEGTMSYQNGFHIWGRFYIAFIERAQSVPSMWIRPRYVLINAVSWYSGIILSSELRKKGFTLYQEPTCAGRFWQSSKSNCMYTQTWIRCPLFPLFGFSLFPPLSLNKVLKSLVTFLFRPWEEDVWWPSHQISSSRRQCIAAAMII